MMMRLLGALLVVAVACSAPDTGAHRGGSADAKPRSLALLVGIDQYAQPRHGSLPELAGAENDVRGARRVLIERFGFLPDEVRLLTGADATHEAIVSAFHEHLIARAGAGTRVVFWFSGHGSRTLDLAGVETSKTGDAGDGAFDNTLIAYDSRQRDADGCFDVVDDEIHSLVRALGRRTDRILLVTDCCHSAGAVRGSGGVPPGVRCAQPGRRPLDADRLARFWPTDVPLLDDDAAEPDAMARYVHIAACAEDQEAGEVLVASETFGTLSWFLMRALEEVAPGDSWAELIEHVRARVGGCGTRPDQTVAGFGELDRAVFGGDAMPALRGFRADRVPCGLRIAAGRVHGVTDGAVFDIVGLREGVRCGTARAIQVTAAWSLAAWGEGGEPEGLDGGLRAVPTIDAMAFAPLRVAFEPGLDPDLLRDFPYAVPSDREHADYDLRRTADGARLRDALGRDVRPVPLDEVGLREQLYREYTFRGLWEAVGQQGSWPIALTVEVADEATRALGAGRGLPCAVVTPLPNAGNVAAVQAVPLTADAGGSLVTLRATNRSDRDLRLTILSLSEDRAVNIVWPRQRAPDRVLRRGESQTVPVLVGPAVDWREARPMVDRYLAFATVEPTDFSAFTDKAPVWSASRGGASAVPVFLRRLLDQGTTRGAPSAASGFGFCWCDLHLSSPGAVDGATTGR